MNRYDRVGRVPERALPGLIDAYIPHGFDYFQRWEDVDKAYMCVQQVEFYGRGMHDARKLVLCVEACKHGGKIECRVQSETVQQFHKKLAVAEQHMHRVDTKNDVPRRILLYTVGETVEEIQEILMVSRTVEEYVARVELVLSSILDLQNDTVARTAIAQNLVAKESVFYREAFLPHIEAIVP